MGKFTNALDTIIMSPTILPGQVRFVLSWPKGPKDLDLHSLFKTTRFAKCEVYFGKRLCGQVALDTDNFNYGTNGVETITINTMGSYIYAFAVHKYIDVSAGVAQGDNPIASYVDDSGDTGNSSTDTKQIDVILTKSEAKLSVYVADFKGPIVQLNVPSLKNVDAASGNANDFTWWLAFCLNGKTGVSSLSVVNTIMNVKPDVATCEQIYK